MRIINLGDGLVDSRTRRVQPLNAISDVSFGSGTLEDPFDAEENTKNQYDREEGGKQTDKAHPCGAFAIEHPDQRHAYDEQKDERSKRQPYVRLLCIFT